MAKLNDIPAVDELGSLVDELKGQLPEGDFDKLSKVADQISERADNLAETFGVMNEQLDNLRSRSNTSKSANGSTSSGSKRN